MTLHKTTVTATLRPPLKPKAPIYRPGTIGAIALRRAAEIRLQATRREAAHA